MRKVIGGAFISRDGGGGMEPIFQEAVGHEVHTLFAGDFDLLLGRRTYGHSSLPRPIAPGAVELIARSSGG